MVKQTVLAALSLTLWLTLSLPAAAAFRASSDAARVEESDTFTVTFSYDGSANSEQPDFTPLEKDFEIQGMSTVSQRQIVNGSASSSLSWVLNLRAKRSGTLQIPAIRYANERSEPIAVDVIGLDPQTQQHIGQQVFYTDDIGPGPVYVQSQLTYVRRLYYSEEAQLYGDLPGAPTVENAMVLPLRAAAPSTEVRNGIQYGVVEQRFAIFPQRSGSLAINPVAIEASVASRSSYGGARRRRATVQSKLLNVSVLPQPASYPAGVPWLPAREVLFMDDWANGALQFNVGDPIVRILTLRADGVSKSALPELPMSELDPSFKQYLDEPLLSETTDGEVITGTRTRTMTLVATQPGSYTIPELQVTWFDVDDGEVKRARLPARVVRVGGTALAGVPTGPLSSTLATGAHGATASPPAATVTNLNPLLLGLLLASLLGWGTTYWWLRRRPVSVGEAKAAAPRPVWMGLSDLEAAAKAGDLVQVRTALGQWLSQRWHVSPHQALSRVASAPAVVQLNRALFAEGSAHFDASALLDWARALSVSAADQSAVDSPLPPLYRNPSIR